MRQPRKPTHSNTSIRELENHATAAPVQAIRLVIRRAYHSLLNSGSFIRLNSRLRPTQAHIVYAIIRAVELLTRKHIKRRINNRFSALNNTGLLFAMLYSCKEVHENTEYRVVQISSTIAGAKDRTLWLLNTCKKGVY